MILGSPGPTESCRDSSENVVFTNLPNHEKTFKLHSKSIYFGGPWDTKITKSVKKWTKGNTWKNILRKTQKSRKNTPKWAPKIDLRSIKNRRLGRCLPAGLQNMDFGGPGWISRLPGVPPRAKIDKKRRKTALPNAWKKRYVMLSSFHTLSSRDRNAIQPRRKERSSAQFRRTMTVMGMLI